MRPCRLPLSISFQPLAARQLPERSPPSGKAHGYGPNAFRTVTKNHANHRCETTVSSRQVRSKGACPPDVGGPALSQALVLGRQLEPGRRNGSGNRRARERQPRVEDIVKVLHLISSGGMYGAEVMLMNLARGLTSNKYGVVVGVFHNGQNPHLEVAEQLGAEGIAVELIPCASQVDFAAVRKIRHLIKASG